MPPKPVDMIGKHFGTYKVLRRAKNRGKEIWYVVWCRRARRLKKVRGYILRKQKRPLVETLYWSAKCRAIEKSLPFDLELSDIVVPTHCPLLGVKLSVGIRKPHASSPSLDRKIPSKGHVKGNVWVISRRANTIKQDASLEELKLLVENLEKSL